MIVSGGTITTLEAVVMGVPVIRIIPDNTFSYEAFDWPEYPLRPVRTSGEIRDQLELIKDIRNRNSQTFGKIGREVFNCYFTEPDDDNFPVFTEALEMNQE